MTETERSKVKKRKDAPMVGCGVFIRKDGKYLLGKRKGSHGAGEYSLPGGHVEMWESLVDSAINEVDEETGMRIKNAHVIDAQDSFFPEDGLHYVTVFLLADWSYGEPENKEPHKCEGWDWYAPEDFPEPMFAGTRNARHRLPEMQ